ncbi:hypothetical protein RR48_13550 [Papilio machaon]|uniref:RIIa domain-containing protein n=1 Tax=Papilio machaon TaxID=76193 RepID=A0A194RAF0_PAPMA|nr:hypothetical protein RR48_13550 [Papilio machaon]
MEDLLQSQIKDSCKLALPEGLRDLMCDISREVLRARPQNLYQFIADYLSAMLVARETLTIAGHVCKGVCNCGCEPELDDELGNIGLTQEEVEEAKKIIIQYLEKDKDKKQVHIDFNETEKIHLKNEIDEEIVNDGKFEEFGDEYDNIDDEVLYADDESDISITEDIHEK